MKYTKNTEIHLLTLKQPIITLKSQIEPMWNLCMFHSMSILPFVFFVYTYIHSRFVTDENDNNKTKPICCHAKSRRHRNARDHRWQCDEAF